MVKAKVKSLISENMQPPNRVTYVEETTPRTLTSSAQRAAGSAIRLIQEGLHALGSTGFDSYI